MKVIIASDIHGDAKCTRRLLEIYRETRADRLILLGDILYHGPRNDLPEGYAPKEVIELLNAMADEIICVRGNCDAEVDGMVLKFPIMSEWATFSAGGVRLVANHGHKISLESNPPTLECGDVLLVGHTHVPVAKEFGDNNLYLNPGSLSIPKEGSKNGYIEYEDGIFIFKELYGAPYLVVTAKNK